MVWLGVDRQCMEQSLLGITGRVYIWVTAFLLLFLDYISTNTNTYRCA